MANRKSTSFNIKANTYHLNQQNSLDDIEDQQTSIRYQPSLPAPNAPPIPLPKSNYGGTEPYDHFLQPNLPERTGAPYVPNRENPIVPLPKVHFMNRPAKPEHFVNTVSEPDYR